MLSAFFLIYLGIARLLGIIKYDLGFFFHFGNRVEVEKVFIFMCRVISVRLLEHIITIV